MIPLPIDDLLPTLANETGPIVLTAAPGSGKSTRLPPALLDHIQGQVLVLEPRRIAARSLASRVATERGWKLGQEVGYQVRFDKVGTPATRLWYLTEGILTRRLQDDPCLEGVGAVVLDEFHERSLHADLALGHLAELRATLRPDLRIIVMSATMQAERIATFLQGKTIIGGGAPHPVEIVHRPSNERSISQSVATLIREVLPNLSNGCLLTFLPGEGEIRAVQEMLSDLSEPILPLYGSLPSQRQDLALVPINTRRIVLATNVAETSLTIPDAVAVIDSGWHRMQRLDPDTGIDRLQLERISRFNAIQRSGRAGRTGPGRAWRCWSKLEEQRFDEALDPEVCRVDLAGPLLSLAALCGSSRKDFRWLDAPEPERVSSAEHLLSLLGATEKLGGMLTSLGKKLAFMPVHPRLGRLLLASEGYNARSLGAELAAILSARLPHSVKPDGPDDLCAWLLEWQRAQRGDSRLINRPTVQEILKTAQQLCPGYRPSRQEPDAALVRQLLLHAYPDRIGKRRDGGSNRVSLPGGVEATIDEHSHLFLDAQESARRRSRSGDLIVAAAVQGISGRSGNRTRLSLGLELDEAEVLARSPEMLEETELLRYDPNTGRVQAERTRRLGALVLSCKVMPPDPAKAGAVLAAALSSDALGFLRSQTSMALWLDRHAFLCRNTVELPPFDAERATDFLAILCEGRSKSAEVQALDFLGWLSSMCSQQELQTVERLAPLSFSLPKGRERSIDYSAETPSISSKLQDFFGLDLHPAILDGKVPLLVHLLSPAQRPVQTTRDLPGFWRGNYKQLRKDLRGRYPKHAWPEEPHVGEL